MTNSKPNHLFEEIESDLRKFEVRSDDVFLLGYPKSGTTWSQEMIWLLVNDLNYEGAKVFVDDRFPVLELCGYGKNPFSTVVTPECHWNSIEIAKNLASPRCIKSHLRWEMLPEELLDVSKKAKIIYIARNPKDVCLSSYHYCKNILKIVEGSLEDYASYFMDNIANEIGSYWKHVLNFWNRRNYPNILFIRYEDMKENLSNVIQVVAKFLNKNLTNDQVLELEKWLGFENMKKNAAVNHETLYQNSEFVRVGKVGEHKSEMSAELIKRFDSWIADNLKDSDYKL